MKKRTLKSRVNEILRYKTTCFYNGLSSNFVNRPPKECMRLYGNEAPVKWQIESAIMNGQKMLPRKAREWNARGRRYAS